MIRGSHAPQGSPRSIEQPPEPELLSVRIASAVRLTGISRSRLYELIQSGDLGVKKVGRLTLIPYAELKRLVSIDENTWV